VDAYRRANHEFHILVARASGSRRLADAIERLEEESDRIFNLGLMLRDRGEAVRRQHQKILTALVAGDGDAARRRAIEGIVKAERVIKEALLTTPSLRAATLTTSPAPGESRWAARV
jgi:GntR family transcriptional regulator, transcriptional repressor for pyruvate dehydrogenase complex